MKIKYKYVKLDAEKWAEIDEIRAKLAEQRGSKIYIADVIYEAIKKYREILEAEETNGNMKF